MADLLDFSISEMGTSLSTSTWPRQYFCSLSRARSDLLAGTWLDFDLPGFRPGMIEGEGEASLTDLATIASGLARTSRT
jgi:hypothetical protein